MKVFILAALIAWITLSILPADAREIGFIEDFSLADDRAKVLNKLIPGTDQYYFFNCLHAQHTGDLKKVHQLLNLWIKRKGYTSQVKEILNRQALLEYQENPQKSLEHIRRQLNLQFNHQKQTDINKNDISDTLDPNIISISSLTKNAFSKYKNLQGFEDLGFYSLKSSQLNPDQKRNLLKRLKLPDFPDMAKLVVDDLKYKHSNGFGSYEIHGRLLKSQLDNCLELMPELLDNSNFINIYLTKLAPSDDINIDYDPVEKRAYLERIWNFVKKLSSAHNSLKANILYHILDMNRTQDIYNYDLFMTYIKIPRNTSYMNPDYIKNRQMRHVWANLRQDFFPFTGMKIVYDDEKLVKDYLSYFFIKAKDYNKYIKFIRDSYLKQVFAETKILNGIGDMEQWYSMIEPDHYKMLNERVDIDFCITNKEFFKSDEPVSLKVYIKNVKTLIVKAYELNTLNYYKKNFQEIDTALNLDGLTATWEDVFTYDQPPVRRTSKIFDFPYIDKSGVYIIEFIGNGKSSRAVIRKGKLYFLTRVTAAGHEFVVLDDENKKCANAKIYMSGHEYKPDEDDVITIPFSTDPGPQSIILQNNDFCSIASFEHLSENYALSSGFHIDRESLIKREKAKLLLRPLLTLNSQMVSLLLLQDIRLEVTSIDYNGISSSQEFSDLEIFEDQESVFEFQVPENLASIKFTLKAKIDNISKNKQENLETSKEFFINKIDASMFVKDIFLRHADNNYILGVLGKNGENIPKCPVNLELKHSFFTDIIYITLQTNKKGQINLGKLDNIEQVKAAISEGISHIWNPSKDICQYPAYINNQAQSIIRIPYTDVSKPNYTLLEKRRNTWVLDKSNAVKIKNGFLEITGLLPGNYELFLKGSKNKITIRLSQGRFSDDFVISKHRILEINEQSLLNIQEIETSSEFIQVKLDNITQSTRLHIIQTRFLPDFHIFESLTLPAFPEPYEIRLSKPESQYLPGREIGDEYRYILDRQRQSIDKFPGNMLNQPELLLNPWSIRKTETAADKAKSGEDMISQASGIDTWDSLASDAQIGFISKHADSFSNFDFLAAPQALLNLKPDKNGIITIDRKKFNAHQQLHFIAVDSHSLIYREVSLSDSKIHKKNLCLKTAFDSEKHFTEQKQITFINKEKTFDLKDITTSDFEIYDSLDKVYTLMKNLSQDNTLEEFSFILQWADMDDDLKEEKYSKYSCHELNFFIYHKDKVFFNSIVKPYIQNKKNKTFLDKWLIGTDIKKYLEPDAFQQLNIVEKILLLQQTSKDSQQVKHYVKDLYDMIPFDIDKYNRLFDTALKSRSLVKDTFGFGDAKDKAATRLEETAEDETFFGKTKAAGRGFETKSMAAPMPAMAFDAEADMSMMRKKEAKTLKQDIKKRKRFPQFFQKLDKTKEWAENNYYNLPVHKQNSDLIVINGFWNDFAQRDIAQPFFSKHFQYATCNFSEMMFALSVLDLPFKPKKHEPVINDIKFSIKAASPMLVFHQEIREAKPHKQQTPVLVSQNFFKPDDRYKYVGNEKFDKFIQDEFLFRTAYGCQVVLSNPTSSRQKLHLLLQIPRQAMPLNKGFYTKGIPVNIEPYHTKTFEYYFYFPEQGQFECYPVQVSKNEEYITSALPLKFNVVSELTNQDKESWSYVSQNKTNKQVLDFLKNHNINRIDLSKIAFRMKDKEFFNQTIKLLQNCFTYNNTLWSYSIYHNIPEIISQYLKNTVYADQCGMVINTPLLSIDPVEQKTYQHLEYKPFVNARVHQLGRKKKILNNRFFDQYKNFMKKLSYQPQLLPEDYAAVTYYMLLQGRIAEALDFFKKIDKKQIQTIMQYDYLHAYLDFYTQNFDSARRLAQKYASYPVPKWRNLFKNVLAQLDEIQGYKTDIIDQKDRNQVMDELTHKEASFDFTIEERQLTINYRNLKSCRINYYPMDIELLFSRNPFVQQQTGQFAFIRPNKFDEIFLPKDKNQFIIDIPKMFHNSNLMIEITAKGIKKSKAYYANSLNVQIVENYGQLIVINKNDFKPLATTYVKVYAMMKNGQIQFFKDGYTDFRGRFDYVSLSTDELDHVDKLSLLILSKDHGAVIKEALPPKR